MDETCVNPLARTLEPSTTRRGIVGLLAGGVAALSANARITAAAQGVTVGTFPISFTVENPYTGEVVTAEGVVLFVGGDHFRYELSGVGTSGATYQIFSVDNEGSHSTRRTSVRTAAATFRMV